MVAHQEDITPLTQSALKKIITNMFTHGYGLTSQSKRLAIQLGKNT